ncbi:MAG TPA: DUF4202 family protein, partial [Solirubrobacteraceae bacterium]
MSELLSEARVWVEEAHPHARHLRRTEDWVVTLAPDASERLRLAAVLHDIERAFPDSSAGWDSARDWDNPAYNRWHQDRCADIASQWLRERGAPEQLVGGVGRLIRVHEDGGWPEADLLQAADSLSFLETMVPLVVEWVESGRASPERARAKLQNSLERMHPSLERARELSQPLLREALA